MRRPGLSYLLPAALLLGLLPGGSATLTASTSETTLGGTVTGPSGEALSGVCVLLERGSSGDLAAVTTTGSDGTWSVNGLPEGSYLIGVNSCPDPRPGAAAQWWPGVGDATAARPVELSAGVARTDLDLRLPAAGSLSGIVTDDATGESLLGVCVGAIDFKTGAQGSATTSAAGVYRIATLPAGSYMVTFDDCTSPRTHMGEAYPDVPASADPATALDRVELVDVVVGEEVQGVSAGLGRGGTLTGSVTAQHTGRPARGVCVAAYADGRDVRPATTATGASQSLDLQVGPAEDGGTYELPYLPTGTYRVAVADSSCNDDGYAPTWAGGADRSSAAPLQVVEGQATSAPQVVVGALPSLLYACGFPDQDETSPFTDVRGDSVHAAAIACAADRGLARGTSSSTFDPSAPVRRDQMASFTAGLMRSAGMVLPSAPRDAFTDDDDSIHELAINQLAELGVVGGTGGGLYSPREPVRRNQMATFLVNAYEKVAGFPLQAPGDRFEDDQGDRHEASINKAATAAFTAGVTPTQYSPSAHVRREQMASFLVRTLDRLIRDVRSDLAKSSSPEASAQTSSFNETNILLRHHAGSTIRWNGVLWKVLLHVKRPTAYSHYWFAWHCKPPKHFTIVPIGNWFSTYWCLRVAGGVGF